MSESSVVINRQQEISVYENSVGGITISSFDENGEEIFISFHMIHARSIIQAIGCALEGIEANIDD